MIAGSFDYRRPDSLDEALDLLAEHGDDAAVLSGGQEIVPRLNLGGEAPGMLVDIGRLGELARIRSLDGLLSLGARATHSQLAQSSDVHNRVGLLAEAAGAIGGGTQVRNRGTVGGAIAAANPVYDYPACLLALDTTVHLASRDEHRALAFADFVGADGAARRADELISEVSVQAPPSTHGFAYEKLTFGAGCYLIAGVACIVDRSSDTSPGGVRLAVGGVSPGPFRLPGVESLVSDQELTEELLDEAAAGARRAPDTVLSDALADGDYRRRVLGPLVKRALRRAVGEGEEG